MRWEALGLACVLACACGDDSGTTGTVPDAGRDGGGIADGGGTDSGDTGTEPECTEGADCPGGICAMGACEMAASCLDLLTQRPGTPDGVYTLDGAASPLEAYCDMTRDGGGWTLAMKMTEDEGDPDREALPYDAVYWEGDMLLNATDLTPNTAEGPPATAKLAAAQQVTGTTMRLEWVMPADVVWDYPLNGMTLQARMAGGPDAEVEATDDACNGEALAAASAYDEATMRFGLAEQVFGLNLVSDVKRDGTQGFIRFGFGANDETYNAWSPFIGVGGRSGSDAATASGFSIGWRTTTDCEVATDNCGCYGSGTRIENTRANLWVR